MSAHEGRVQTGRNGAAIADVLCLLITLIASLKLMVWKSMSMLLIFRFAIRGGN